LEGIKTIHFWKAYSISNQKNQVLHLPWVQYGRHPAFYNMAAMKQGLVNVSARFLWKVWKLYIFGI